MASLALHTVLEPVFTEVSGSHSELAVMFVMSDFQMEREESLLASVQTLRDAFTKVFISSFREKQYFHSISSSGRAQPPWSVRGIPEWAAGG